jgi:eukaryotic-like serine/threonine-protein kinase
MARSGPHPHPLQGRGALAAIARTGGGSVLRRNDDVRKHQTTHQDMSPEQPAERTQTRRGLVGRVIGERYRVTRMVAAGANALIVDAADLELDRPVTIKLVRPEWAESAEFRRRFAAEMRTTSSLSHPNLAAVHDWGEEDIGKRTTVYVVSEQLAGGSLRDLFDRGRRLSPSQALMVGLEACRGLDFAHRRGLVHTEVTPSKLVFGDDRRLRIVDFGLARLLGERHWAEPATVPTHVARYCSPEQALGQPVDGKSDVYSLALVLVEGVTAAVPFAARSTVATLSARVGKLMPVSADLGSLASVLEKAGRPDPEDRSTAAEFGRGLVKAAETLPRPAPIPIVVAGTLAEDPTTMRRPDDPTGGITRPSAEPAPAVAPPAPSESAPAAPLPPPTAESVQPSTPVVPAKPEDPTAPVVAAAGVAAAPRLYDGDADRTIDELAELARPAGEQPPETDPVVRAPAGAVAGPPSGQTPGPSPPAARPRRRWLAWLGAVVVLAALAGLGYLAYVLFRTPTHEVPDLTGLTEADARAQTADFDWEIDVQRERSDEEPDPGDIIRTAPEAGERLAEGEPFLVVVSEGPEFRDLPDVAGKTLADAETALARLDLAALQPTREHDERVPVGSVVSWSVPAEPTLAAGDPVLPDTEVALVVSSGPAPRNVPNLVNMTFGDARAALRELRLHVRKLEPRFSNDIPKGSVIMQNPDPRSKVPRGSVVRLRLSKGPDLRHVPRLEGLTLPQARERLRNAGLRVGDLLGSTRGVVVDVTIDDEPVAPGDLYVRGTHVDLVLF